VGQLSLYICLFNIITTRCRVLRFLKTDSAFCAFCKFRINWSIIFCCRNFSFNRFLKKVLYNESYVIDIIFTTWSLHTDEFCLVYELALCSVLFNKTLNLKCRDLIRTGTRRFRFFCRKYLIYKRLPF